MSKKNSNFMYKLLMLLSITTVFWLSSPAKGYSDSPITEIGSTNNSEKKITKEGLQDFINYFCEAEVSEDEEFQQAFPWRSFRSQISKLSTPEESLWILETLPSWPDGRDQETLDLLAKTAGKLANKPSIEKALEIANSNAPDYNKLWSLVVIESVDGSKNSEILKSLINNPTPWLKTQKELSYSPPVSAAKALGNMGGSKNTEFLLNILKENITQDQSKKSLTPSSIKALAAQEGLLSLKSKKDLEYLKKTLMDENTPKELKNSLEKIYSLINNRESF